MRDTGANYSPHHGGTDDGMCHFIPTEFHPLIACLIDATVESMAIPVEASDPLVETKIIESPHGTILVLTNWRGQPVRGLRLTTSLALPAKDARLPTGSPLHVERKDGQTIFTLDFERAGDVLILR
ncbi:MAG: hypothetical protein RMM51_06855 [Verrucomicrobiae bacterium]|nr:hypothetical protein [Verrucomicrobiae bacterium]